MSRISARRLEAALVRFAEGLGGTLTIEGHDWTPWASATFIGSRHTIRYRAEGDWLAVLADAELPMPGRFVADIGVAGATIEALVLEE